MLQRCGRHSGSYSARHMRAEEGAHPAVERSVEIMTAPTGNQSVTLPSALSSRSHGRYALSRSTPGPMAAAPDLGILTTVLRLNPISVRNRKGVAMLVTVSTAHFTGSDVSILSCRYEWTGAGKRN